MALGICADNETAVIIYRSDGSKEKEEERKKEKERVRPPSLPDTDLLGPRTCDPESIVDNQACIDGDSQRRNDLEINHANFGQDWKSSQSHI